MATPDKDEALVNEIKEIWSRDHHYGVRRVYLALRKLEDFKNVNHKKVQRIMRELGLQGIGYRKLTRKYDSSKGPEGKRVKNRLHRKFKTDRPMQKLVSDVTEFKIPKTGERIYLEPIMDLYNNEILTYSIGTRPDLSFTQAPLNELVTTLPKLSYRTTIHTDQGWQYRHRAWRKTLKEHNIFQSMSRKATALDNAVIESFFNKLKVEVGSLKQFANAEHLMNTIKKWLDYYNNERIQTKLKGASPVEYRQHAS